MTDGLNSYRQVDYLTASPLKLVVMCYEQAIAQIKAAKEAYEKGDYATKGKCVTKSIDIIHELNSSLDMERGGEISQNLRRLYLYILKTITEADLKRDLGKFEHVVHILEELAEAWRTLASEQIKAEDKRVNQVPYGQRQTIMTARNWQV